MSSTTLEQIIQHFTHIHPLTKVDGCGEFTCDGCKTYGYGKTYRCAMCNYGLHDHCATCPPNHLSFMHPQHELQLVCKRPEQTHQDIRICDICDESVEGMYYHCEPCGFDVHPLCTQLPQHVRHVPQQMRNIPHPAHILELSPGGASNTCLVCQGVIQSWRYKCGPCGSDIHMECVNSFASSKPATIQQRGFEWQPQSQMSYPFDQHHQLYPPNQHHQVYPPDQQHQVYPPDQQHQSYPPYQYHQSYPFDQQHQSYPPDQQHKPYPPDHHHEPYPSDPHHPPYVFYHHHQPYPSDQHYHIYNDHGYNYGYINQAQVQEVSNQGQVQESSPSKGKKMFSILKALTTGVVCNIIASPICAVLGPVLGLLLL